LIFSTEFKRFSLPESVQERLCRYSRRCYLENYLCLIVGNYY